MGWVVPMPTEPIPVTRILSFADKVPPLKIETYLELAAPIDKLPSETYK